MARNRIFIIAEAGVNHNGSIQIARKLIDAAASAGADAVKFQTFRAEDLVTENASKAGYQKKTTGARETQFQMLKKLELSYPDFKALKRYCAKRGIEFMSTPFDAKSADFLASIGMKRFKIPSGEITNRPLVEHIAAKHREIILSTGMAGMAEVRKSVSWIKNIWKKSGKINKLTVLHCVSNYPAAFEDLNLSAIKSMGKALGLPAGYSDHSTGTEACVASVALGAAIIEKHFTLDRKMRGPDHSASVEPRELKQLVTAVRNIEKSLGNGIKKPVKNELPMRDAIRKSVVAARFIGKGEVFTPENLAAKRPGRGIQPGRIKSVLGARAKKNFRKDELIKI